MIDLSHPLEHGMPVYPGDEAVVLTRTRSVAEDQYCLHSLTTGMHAGTHLDAPMHLLEDGRFIGEWPVDAFCGTGCLFDVRGQATIAPRCSPEDIPPGAIVLLYTGWDEHYGQPAYYEGHPTVDEAFCRVLLERRVKMLGLDMPSPDYIPFPVHKMLLANDVFILENLTGLSALVGVTRFEVMAFPLRLQAEGSLVRAVARVLEE